MNRPSPSRVANRYAHDWSQVTPEASAYWKKLKIADRFDWLAAVFGSRPGGKTFAAQNEQNSGLQFVVNEAAELWNWRTAEEFSKAVHQEALEPSSSETNEPELSLETVLQKYVQDSGSLNSREIAYLRKAVENSTVAPGIRRLERVQIDVPRWREGETVNFSVASFSSAEFSKGESAGQISWKSSDGSLVRVENPRRGLTVNYEGKQFGFPASAERETLLTGRYRVSEVKRIPEPGTKEDEYRGEWVPLYILREA